jgi:hypothetical protein
MPKNFFLLILVLAFCANPILAAETTQVLDSDPKHEEYKKLIREKTRGMKEDAKAIKQAISDDYKSSTDELKNEYKRLEKLYEDFKADMALKQKELAEEKKDLETKFVKRQKDLEELIQTMLTE